MQIRRHPSLLWREPSVIALQLKRLGLFLRQAFFILIRSAILYVKDKMNFVVAPTIYIPSTKLMVCSFSNNAIIFLIMEHSCLCPSFVSYSRHYEIENYYETHMYVSGRVYWLGKVTLNNIYPSLSRFRDHFANLEKIYERVL